MLKRLHIGFLGSLLIFAVCAEAHGQTFNQLVGFGDSSIDNGYFRTHPFGANQALYNASVAVGGGIPTTPGSPMAVDVLGGYFGLSVIPDGMPGGINFAASGATNTNTLNTPLAPNTVSQIQTYLSSVGSQANPNALFVISSGANDVVDALNKRIAGTFTEPQALSYVQGQADALIGALKQLKAAGAKFLIVPNCFGGDCSYTDPRPPTQTHFPRLHLAYHDALWNGLAGAGINFIPADLNSLYRAIQSNPAAFGFSNIDRGSTVTNTGGACLNPSNGSNWAQFAPRWSRQTRRTASCLLTRSARRCD